MPKLPSFLLEVAPLVPLPGAREPVFTYTSEVSVPKGSVVSISFGRRQLEGVVISSRRNKNAPKSQGVKLKKIDSVLEPKALTVKQVRLAEALGSEYFTPLGKTLGHFWMPRVKARKQEAFSETSAKLIPSAEEKKHIASWRKGRKPFFLDMAQTDNIWRWPALLTDRVLTEKKQTLILVPELTLLDPLSRFFREFFPGEMLATIGSTLSPGLLSENWERIRNGEARIILATRQGLFAPFQDLGLIIVTYEEDMSYKEWHQAPRYHAKRVASLLAEEHDARLVLASPTGSLESFWGLAQKNFLPFLPENKGVSMHHLEIVNLREERYRKNFSPFSRRLEEAVGQTIAEHKQVLLGVSRSGMSRFSICTHCRTLLRCPLCGRTLSETSEGFYRCPTGDYRTSTFPNCPSCGHIGFQEVGFGTEKVERLLKRTFPKARLLRIDGKTLGRTTARRAAWSAEALAEADIIIGTQMALKAAPLPRLGLAAMMDADNLFSGTGYQNDEYGLALIAGMSAFSNTGPLTAVLVQTFFPENSLLQSLKVSGYRQTVETLLLPDRLALEYPPITRVLKASIRPNIKKAAAFTQAALERFSKDFPEFRWQKTADPKKDVFLVRFPSGPLPAALWELGTRLRPFAILDLDPLDFS